MTLARGVRRPADRGSASILTLAIVMVVVMLGAAIVAGAAASAVRVAAQHAADEAVLAGAHVARGERALGRDPAARACSAASVAAGDNGAHSRRCAVDGAVVTVEVSLRRGPAEVRATAVAGPGHAAPG